MSEQKNKLLEVKDLKVSFFTPAGEVKAVGGISYDLDYGEVMGVVGESGSGKSQEAYSIMGLLQSPGKVIGGSITFEGKDVLSFSKEEMTAFRGNKVAMIFQNPMTCLNPVYTIGNQLVEALRAHDKKISKEEAQKRAMEMMELVGINNVEKRMKQYPHEFSGGMRQRVMIAMGLICHPQLLIADEPTTALDVTIQAQILDLMKDLQKKTGMGIIFITHNLGVVADICDKVSVMYAGKIVEQGPVDDIFYEPAHPYTKGLLRSMPRVDAESYERLIPIEGTPVDMLNPPEGCPFAPRCEHCMKICLKKMPPYVEVGEKHRSACWLRVQELMNKEEKSMAEEKKLLEIENLRKYFPVNGIKGPGVQAVQDVSLYIKKGETLGLVGESGCGKTTLGRTILRLYEPTGGKIIYDGETIYDNPLDKDGKPLGKAKAAKMLPYRRKMQIIFQDPSASLDPRMTVGEIIGEAIDIHKLAASKKDRADMIKELLAQVGLNTEHANRYPHEFSGGQQQRVGIARALAVKPEFIVCDEPISALDVSIQSQVVNMLEDMQEQMGLTYLFIAHDLSVVRHISNRIGVMYLGSLVELGESYELNRHPIHPYTQTLLSAVPVPDPKLSRTRKRIILEGDVPSPMNPPSGCRFHTRCPYATEKCSQVAPVFREHEPGHWAACHLLDK